MLSYRQLEGLLVGAAVGDSLGLPFEGLSPRSVARLRRGPLRQRWLFGRGMISDDTEHAAFTVRALAAAGPDDPASFARHLARHLRWWFAALPPSLGWATLRACLKLWIGISPRRSGVRSAGNGALIRAVVIGAIVHDPIRRARLVEASTRITHTDPRALAAAHALADVATLAATGAPLHLPHRPPRPTAATGYAPHTTAAVLWAWSHHHDDPAAAITAVIDLGDDTDSTGALVGALAGVRHGADAFPPAWVERIHDLPRSLLWLRRAAFAAAHRTPWPGAPFPLALVRNLAFGLIAVAHVLHRRIAALVTSAPGSAP